MGIHLRMYGTLTPLLILSIVSLSSSYQCHCRRDDGPGPIKPTDCESGEIHLKWCQGGWKKVCTKTKGEICGGQCDVGEYCASNTHCNGTETSDYGIPMKLSGFCVENTPRDCPEIEYQIGILQTWIKSHKRSIARGYLVKRSKIGMNESLKKIRNLKKSNKHICQFV